MNALPSKLVILDKSFLQAESQRGERLSLMCDCGASLVLTDTLVYEFGTDERLSQWPAAQRKLFNIADNVEVWFHVSDLLRFEIDQQRPVETPVNHGLTERYREWFRKGETYVPKNLAALAQEAKQQREVDSVNALITYCLSVCQMNPKVTAGIQNGGDEAVAVLSDVMVCHEIIASLVRKAHGNAADTEMYIRGAEEGLGPKWFAYQHAKSTLALCCHFMLRYGMRNPSGKDFIHTKLDADYVALLHYADVLATNETNSLAEICRWMHGRSKIILSTKSLDGSKPTEDNIRVEAYGKWVREGRTHGHDQDDWSSAKAELLWRAVNIDSQVD